MSKFLKFNTQHGADGRFTGPGTSHQPTGNPVGRPATGPNAAPAGRPRYALNRTAAAEGEASGRQYSAIAGAGAGGLAGGIAGDLATPFLTPGAAAVGGALGSVFGPAGMAGGAALGAAAAKYATPIITSAIGDYVGTKIATALYDIKAGMDGQPVGSRTAVGELTARDTAGVVGSEVGGWGVYGAALAGLKFLPEGSALRTIAQIAAAPGAEEVGQGVRRAVARTAGRELPSELGSLGGFVGGVKAYDIARGGKGAAAPPGREPHLPGKKMTRGVIRGARDVARAVSKSAAPQSLFDPKAQPKGYGGSFLSMYRQAPPHLFGPSAWAKVKGTPFGAYVLSRIKETAQRMDDAAFQHGIDLEPLKPGQLALSQAHVGSLPSVQADTQSGAVPMPSGHAPQLPLGGRGLSRGGGQVPPPQANSPSPVAGGIAKGGKLFRGANDVNDAVSNDAYRTGGPANRQFLARMQESERRQSLFQMDHILAQPKIENIERRPTEDEQQYEARMRALGWQSVGASDSLKPGLFSNDASAPVRVKLRKKREPDTRPEDFEFTLSTEIDKTWQSEDKLEKGLIYGFASVIEKDGQVVTDHQGDRISEDELQKAAHDFITNSRQGGVLHDKYGNEIGRIVESVVLTKDLQKHLGMDGKKIGWLVCYKTENPKIKKLVRSGVLKSFSIGGRGRRVPVEE